MRQIKNKLFLLHWQWCSKNESKSTQSEHKRSYIFFVCLFQCRLMLSIIHNTITNHLNAIITNRFSTKFESILHLRKNVPHCPTLFLLKTFAVPHLVRSCLVPHNLNHVSQLLERNNVRIM